MAKKASKKAKASKAKPRSTKKAARGGRKSMASKKGSVDLKKIKNDLGRALAHVRQRPAKDVAQVEAGVDTATILTRMMADIDDICTNGDCGDTMIFPPPPPSS